MEQGKIKIVLDTNVFVNPDFRYLFGKTPEEAFNNFLSRLEKKTNVTCYMPPSIYQELLKFIGYTNIPRQTILIHKKPPSRYETTTPALMFYEFIEELRNRINKGLRIAEKYTRQALNYESEKEQEIIKSLREEYRIALREGILDSSQDWDQIGRASCRERV